MTGEEAQAANDEIERAYKTTFGSPDGRIVLLDLMKHCHFRTPLPDGNRDIAEGERRVFVRIMQFVALEHEQLVQLFAGRRPIPTGD